MGINQLTIISRRESVTAQSLINGNKVTFAYEVNNNQINAVAFSVQRGVEQDGVHHEAFSGTVVGESFNVQNHAYQTGDSAMYEDIYTICKDIMTREVEDEDV